MERQREKQRQYTKTWKENNPTGQRDADRRWRLTHPEEHLKRNRDWMKNNPERRIWHSAKGRARKANVPFDITPSDISIPTHCPVLGIPLFFSEKGRSDNSPSLDRKNPQAGYIRSNIAVISFRANRIKNDSTPEELEKILRWVRVA